MKVRMERILLKKMDTLDEAMGLLEQIDREFNIEVLSPSLESLHDDIKNFLKNN